MIKILSKNSKKILCYLAKNPSNEANINKLSRLLGISVGSVHQILKEFEKDKVVVSESIGNSIMYKLNFANLKAQRLIDESRLNEPNEHFKKTKIVCTIGPACNNVAMIREMINNGMNVARINASHCDEKSILEMVRAIRKADEHIPVLVDIPGFKIRVGYLKNNVSFKKGETVKFCCNKKEGCIPVEQNDLHKNLSEGVHFSIDDGAIGLKIEKINDDIISCIALSDGIIKSRKGVNIPELKLEGGCLTDYDKKLIKFAIKNNVNFVGVSFIKNAEQVEKINELIKGSNIKLISKIETEEAIGDYPKIIEKSYGIMIDRGDLGAEVGLEKIPRLQKKVIEECNKQGKPVIVATQMLDSMTYSPYPTKSEITDVANAVLDGASALMLSAETAVGKYPGEAVLTMSNIISDIEGEISPKTFDGNTELADFTSAMGGAVAGITSNIKIDKILCITSGGFSARMLARHKLSIPIIAVTNKPSVYSIMHLIWGINPLLVSADIDNSASVNQKKEIITECLNKRAISKEDIILLLGAVFPNNRKITNMVELHKVHEFLGYFEELEK